MDRKSISVVAPVHNEALNLVVFNERLTEVFANLEYELEMIFVDDGSRDESFAVLMELASKNPNLRAIKLTRNFGHQNAVSCGLAFATGCAVVIIDADLQDPPELIPRLIEEWKKGYKNVYAVRRSRAGESKFKEYTAKFFYRVLSKISDYPIPLDAGDFRLIDRQVVVALNQMPEENRFLRGMISWIGFPSTGVLYDREPRLFGKTSYSLFKMLKFAQNGIFGFSSKPLKISTYLGIFGILFSFLYGVYTIVQKLINPLSSTAGFPTIMIAITSIGSIQLLSIGLLGEYLQRIYVEVKRRPLYLVERILNDSK
jgi:dolichol-phosphate mannosyltransferase